MERSSVQAVLFFDYTPSLSLCFKYVQRIDKPRLCQVLEEH